MVGGHAAAWLEGYAAKAFACDASITPAVKAGVNPAVLDALVRLCLELAGIVPAAAATALTSAAAPRYKAHTFEPMCKVAPEVHRLASRVSWTWSAA